MTLMVGARKCTPNTGKRNAAPPRPPPHPPPPPPPPRALLCPREQVKPWAGSLGCQGGYVHVVVIRARSLCSLGSGPVC